MNISIHLPTAVLQFVIPSLKMSRKCFTAEITTMASLSMAVNTAAPINMFLFIAKVVFALILAISITIVALTQWPLS